MKLLALTTFTLSTLSFPFGVVAETEDLQETVFRYFVDNQSNEIITIIPRLRSGGLKPPKNPGSIRIGIGERKFIGMDSAFVDRTPGETFCEIALQLSRYEYKSERRNYRYHPISLAVDDWSTSDKKSVFYSYRRHRTFVIDDAYIKRVMPKN